MVLVVVVVVGRKKARHKYLVALILLQLLRPAVALLLRALFDKPFRLRADVAPLVVPVVRQFVVAVVRVVFVFVYKPSLVKRRRLAVATPLRQGYAV